MPKNKSATKKILLIVAGLIVLLVLLGVGASLMSSGNSARAVETASVEYRSVTQLVTGSGKVQPEVQVNISPDVSGEIIELPVQEGDYVEQGQLLARLEPEIYRQQVAQQEASVQQQQAAVQSAQANLMQAEAAFERNKKLYERDAISVSTYQDAKTSFDVAKANYEAAVYSLQSIQARLGQSREQLNKTAIFSPMSGTVSKLNVERGERVVGTSQMAGTELMQIARLDGMEMLVDVNENDVIHVSLGDTARLMIDAYPSRTFLGVVTSIAHSARISAEGTQNQVTNFPVKISIMGPASAEEDGAAQALEVASSAPVVNLRPGMSGTADIRTETISNVLAVPIQAVTVRDFNKVKPQPADTARDIDGDADSEEGQSRAAESDVASADNSDSESGGDAPAGSDSLRTAPTLEEDLREVVFVVDEGKARMHEVQTGIADATHLVVLGGLREGEEVIIGPYRAVSRELEPGMAVNPDGNPWRQQ